MDSIVIDDDSCNHYSQNTAYFDHSVDLYYSDKFVRSLKVRIIILMVTSHLTTGKTPLIMTHIMVMIFPVKVKKPLFLLQIVV